MCCYAMDLAAEREERITNALFNINIANTWNGLIAHTHRDIHTYTVTVAAASVGIL